MRAAAALLFPMMMQASGYSARQVDVDGVAVIQLSDTAHGAAVSIAPSIGNMAYEFKVHGKNVLWFPFQSPAELRDRPAFSGIPFLAPWANRLEGDYFWANGKKYLLRPDSGNIRRDAHQKPIHGLLNFSPEWVLQSAAADQHSAWTVSRLEFWKDPTLMAQFPFAHTITMTYRLSRGVLEVETSIENLAAAPMPVAIGFHPYFQVLDAPRDRWKVHIAARDHMILSDLLLPTGEFQVNDPSATRTLDGTTIDDVFTNLVRDASGRAHFWVEGKKERVSVIYGPKFNTAVVYAPARDFICFEPMSAITNAFNMAHAGTYRELQTIAPAGTWKESFWIAPSGF
jgi:aldose 1-epimerase